MFIAEPRLVFKEDLPFGTNYNGLFIEIKKEGTKLYKKDNTFTTPHIQEQWGCILGLQRKGYMADFGIGFDECKTLIDQYLK